jgi:hypothetical protein
MSRGKRQFERSALAEASWREWRRANPVTLGESAEVLFKAGWAAGRRMVLGLASFALLLTFMLFAGCVLILVVK